MVHQTVPFDSIAKDYCQEIDMYLEQHEIVSLPVVYAPNLCSFLASSLFKQGWRQKFSDRGAGASDRGAKRTKKMVFLCVIFPKFLRREPKFPPTSDGGLDASNGGLVASNGGL